MASDQNNSLRLGNGRKRSPVLPEDTSFTSLPLIDHSVWYYPSQGYDDSDEELLDIGVKGGNWGNKMVRGARWVRRGKIAAWGPGMDEWEEEDRARKRVKMLLPSERRSSSPPTLPHLQSPPPPLVSPYPQPTTHHLSYSSFLMDKAVTHSFRSSLLNELEQATNHLIEGEATMRKALNRLWQVVAEDCDGPPVLVLKREEDDDIDDRIARAPDLTPPTHKVFLPEPEDTSDQALQQAPPAPVNSAQAQAAAPSEKEKRLESAIAVIKELQDDGREYVERLEEIREGLGDVRAQRDVIWNMIRENSVKELQDAAFAPNGSISTIPRAFILKNHQSLMTLPNLSNLSLRNSGPAIPEDIANATDRYLLKLKIYAKNVPYAIESNSEMQKLLDFIILRVTQCVAAKDYDPGLLQWDIMFNYWVRLKYPIPKDKRILLCQLYFAICTTPGMSTQVVAACADTLQFLTRSHKKLSIEDMRLPWKPIYNILKKDLFLSRREFEYTQLSWYMGNIGNMSRRFFHPAAIEEMLTTFVPLINGTDLDSVLASQYYLLSFLPLSHPTTYLPMLFRLWESINSYKYDERMLHFLAQLAELHLDPNVSDPKRIRRIPDDAKSEGEGRPEWSQEPFHEDKQWPGIFKNGAGVGIFSEHEWHLIMCKCLASMEIPLADAGSLTTGSSADSQAGFEIGRLPKPTWRISSLARIIIYSMASDSLPNPSSNAPTPVFTPLPSGLNTPMLRANGSAGDYLSTPLMKAGHWKARTYLGGSKALDSLARMIASTESFFHPSNSGSWTNDLSAFLKYIAYNFNRRWYEEQQPDCKTPKNRRLTKLMKRELVKSLRTACLLAMFSHDSTTVSNIQSCFKSLSIMEPDLILYPIMERALPSLESLVETERTLAVIKSLGAVAPAIVSRQVFYPGAKHLVPVLQLLLPGIDLNDPSKTLYTTSFFVEISQYIMIGDLSEIPEPNNNGQDSRTFQDLEGRDQDEPALLDREEDLLVRDTTGSFADWVTSFVDRVIQLLENLPDEGENGSAGGALEVQVVDAVTGACSQICVHLSEPLYDLVLGKVYQYASTNVRSNAVRAIHQLVECVANADPAKTLAKFLPICLTNVESELENGASSLRTTSTSTPLPSDATLHWNLAILRGAVYNDGRAVLKYKDQFLSLFRLLLNKTFSKRSFSWSGKLVSSTLLTLTHVYPLENRFVNPDEWNSEEFRNNHHRYWGKLYKPEDIIVSWHHPNDSEIDFAIQIFKDLVEPTMSLLDELLSDSITRDAVWRNDFCRYLSFVRNAFSGIPTLAQSCTSPEDWTRASKFSDILNEIPEMIAVMGPVKAGFVLSNPTDPRHRYIIAIRQRFGRLLHKASASLLQQGEENTVDAVQMLIRSLRTYMLDYGDSRDSFFRNRDQYTSEKNMARQYAKQKVWPRAVYIRRARYYQSARLRWNSMERLRGPLEDSLVDDLIEWSMWHYATVRRSSQSLLESLCSSYDGIRHRSLAPLYKALEPGTDDKRMKGALWTLNSSSFGKYAIAEPTLATELLQRLFACQSHENASIQDSVFMVLDSCLNNFQEACYLVYEVNDPAIQRASLALRHSVSDGFEGDDLMLMCQAKRVERVKRWNAAIRNTTQKLFEIMNNSRTHWRYAIVAIRMLRTLIRRDVPMSAEMIRLFLEKSHDNNGTIRYYAYRGIMKSCRYIKYRSFSLNAAELCQDLHHNPLKISTAIRPSNEVTIKILGSYKKPLNLKTAKREPLFCDKLRQGWLAWSDVIDLYVPPSHTEPTFFPYEKRSEAAVASARAVVTRTLFWEMISTHFSEENGEVYVSQDHISCVKSIFQLLDDEPFDAMRPTLENLLANENQDKQRAAAELLAGVLNGSKHWPTDAQGRLWEWFIPMIKRTLNLNIKTDTLMIWTTFLEYMFHNTDPRRVQPLVDFVMDAFNNLDFNGESSFDAMKVLSLLRAVYEELNWKFSAWIDDILDRCWPQIHSEHDEVRGHIGEILAFSGKIKWQPKVSVPSVEMFVNECRISSLDFDIMGMRGIYHQGRVLELVEQFKVWRSERVPGVRAFQSSYDRVGIAICKWLFQMVHDTQAISVFDYILPLMPELFRFTEVNDNEELESRANVLLVKICGVTPPRALVDPIFDAIFQAIRESPSWRVRLKALPLVQVFYFRQLPLVSEFKIVEILEVLCACLDDVVVEVREMAAVTLSGILRLSPKRSVMTLKDRFVRLAKKSYIPDRQSPAYNKAVRQRHAAILGICALVESYPYTVEKWMPDLLTSVLAEHTYDPIPISTTVRKCASNFKRTHQDTWHEDSKQFNDHQLAALSTLLTGSSYYA